MQFTPKKNNGANGEKKPELPTPKVPGQLPSQSKFGNLVPKQSQVPVAKTPTEPAVTFAANTNIAAPKKLDMLLSIVFDTTGSMDSGEVKQAMKKAALEVIQSIISAESEAKVEIKVQIVVFGDLVACAGHDKVEVACSFTSDLSEIATGFDKMFNNGGGGNGGECSYVGMDIAMRQYPSGNALKFMILFTDESPLPPTNLEEVEQYSRLYYNQHRSPVQEQELQSLIEQSDGKMSALLKKTNTCFFAVTINDSSFKTLAQQHGGQWLSITAHTDLSVIVEQLKTAMKQAVKTARVIQRDYKGDVSKFKALPQTTREQLLLAA